MRARSDNQSISVRAIAGTHVVLLGLDATEKAARGLMGFAIQRHDHTTKRKTWLRGPLRFKEKAAPGVQNSLVAPIQAFLWGDYQALPGRKYSYTVVPMYGEPGQLKRGKSIRVTATTESEEDQKHAVIFNRGVAGSQAYSRRFGKHRKWYKVEKAGRTRWNEYTKPDEVPDDKAWTWLSRGLGEAMLRFIGQARGPEWGIRAAVYEFEHLPAIQAFVDALESGADVKIVYDAKPSASGPVENTKHALKQIGLTSESSIPLFEAMMIPRVNTTISHNKFVVLLKNGEPVQVWTGSTNFTAGGIFGQSNLGHVVRDKKVAATYLDYWEKVSTDPKKKSLKSDPPDLGMRNWTVAQQPDLVGAPPPNSTTPVFSPRLTTGMLEWYADRLAAAKSSVHFTAAFGVSQEIGQKLIKRRRVKKGEAYQRYILLESRPSFRSSKKRKDSAREKGRPVPVDYWDFKRISQNRISWGDLQRLRKGKSKEEEALQPLQETLPGINLFVEFLHTKYMLIDPLSDDPVVISGSANFSENSTIANDENMLIIRGNKRVADIFLTEYMRLFNHFEPRNRINAMSDEEFEASSHLADDDSWTEPYYKAGSQLLAERILFS